MYLNSRSTSHNYVIINSIHLLPIARTLIVKYFFLSEGWTVGRVWASDGLWQAAAWRREPNIQKMNFCLVEKDEMLYLYQVEDAILTIEVKPIDSLQVANHKTIGQVVIKRLMSAEQILERLGNSQAQCLMENIQAVVQ